MGSKQSTETKNEILNDTNFRNAVRKSNQLINDITSSLVQKNLMSTSSTASTKQELEISNLQAKGDITLSNISQKSTVTINVSALSDTDLKQELAQEVTNELKDKIRNLSESSQKALEDNGEQIFAEIVGALSETVSSLGQSATGGSSKDKTTTSLKNLIGVDNDTDLENIVNEAVNTSIMSETVNEISNAIVGDQSIKFNNIRSEEGKIVISDISQEILTEQIQNSIQKSGLSDSVIAKFSGFSTTEIENINKATQDLTSTKQSTLDATFGGLSGLVQSSMIPFIVIGIVVVVVVFFGIFLFMNMGGSSVAAITGSSSNVSTSSGTAAEGTSGSSTTTIPTIGAGNTSTIWWVLGGILLIIIVIVIIIIVYYATKSSKKESFKASTNLNNLNIKIDGKWLDNSNPPKFIKNKELAQTISVTLLNKTYLYISKNMPGNKKASIYLKYNKTSNIFSFEPFKIAHKNLFKFKYISTSTIDNNMYYLMINDAYLMLNKQTNVLNTSNQKNKAAVIQFVENKP